VGNWEGVIECSPERILVAKNQATENLGCLLSHSDHHGNTGSEDTTHTSNKDPWSFLWATPKLLAATQTW
jgi:hypothetical protein